MPGRDWFGNAKNLNKIAIRFESHVEDPGVVDHMISCTAHAAACLDHLRVAQHVLLVADPIRHEIAAAHMILVCWS